MGNRASRSFRESDLLNEQAYQRGDAVRVVVISDTHGAFNTADDAARIPAGDILLHCGDMTADGSLAELQQFNSFLALLPHPVKVAIGGNHDLCCHPESYLANVEACNASRKALHVQEDRNRLLYQRLRAADGVAGRAAVCAEWRAFLKKEVLTNVTHYVENAPLKIPIAGLIAARRRGAAVGAVSDSSKSIKLLCASFCNPIRVSSMNAFAMSESEQQALLQQLLPASVDGEAVKIDVLMTHSPPLSVLDSFMGTATGSRPLAQALAQLQLRNLAPKFHVFGHVHKQHGVCVGHDVRLPSGETENAAATAKEEEKLVVSMSQTVFINASSSSGWRKHNIQRSPAVVFDIPLDELGREEIMA